MSHALLSRSGTVVTILLVASGTPVIGQERLDLRPLVSAGDAAPGLPGVTFAEVDGAWVNSMGHVAFWARLSGPDLTPVSDQSVWVAGDGGVTLVARAGEPLALPLQERTASAFGQVVLRDDGVLVVLANMDDGTLPYSQASPPRTAVLFESDGRVPRLIAAEETMEQTEQVVHAAASNEGVVAFCGWTFRNGELVRWLPPRFDSTGWVNVEGRLFAGRVHDDAVVGQGGAVVFREFLEDPVGRVDTVNALLRHVSADTATPLLLFRGEETTPFTSVRFADVSRESVVRPDGALVVGGRLRSEHGGRSGVWTVAGAGASVIVQEGELLPGSSSERFGSFVGGPAMNVHGDLAVQAFIEPSAGQPAQIGIWCLPENGDAWETARTGREVPGMGGVTYVHLTQPTMTEAGRVVFMAGVTGDTIGEFTETALVASSRNGGATVLARTGAEMVLDGVAGVVRSVSFVGGQMSNGERQVHSHGAADEIVCHLLFEDGRSGLVRAIVGHGADIDQDGAVDLLDLMQYLDFWFAGSGRADIEPPAVVDVFDLLAFLDCWLAGVGGGDCP